MLRSSDKQTTVFQKGEEFPRSHRTYSLKIIFNLSNSSFGDDRQSSIYKMTVLDPEHLKMMGSVMIWVLQIISLSPVTLNPKNSQDLVKRSYYVMFY